MRGTTPTSSAIQGSPRVKDFVQEFFAASDIYRSQYIEKWREVIANFMVEPEWQTARTSQDPYRNQGRFGKKSIRQVLLKDPETHKIVMTYTAKLMRALFANPRREYVQAVPGGWEDAAEKAPTVTRLLRYVFGLEGHYRTMQEWVTDGLLIGTSIVESCWKYREMDLPVVTVEDDGYGEMHTTAYQRIPVYDDVAMRVIDVEDFYPDPSRSRIEDMAGCGKTFRMNRFEAERMAESGVYDPAATQQAIDKGPVDPNAKKTATFTDFRRGLDKPSESRAPTSFKDMDGREYWGETPDGRRTVTLLNGILVRNRPYLYADAHLPFHALTINPLPGRFYGVSPAETVRYDQSFADAIKILLAEAIIRQVHPPIAFDDTSEVDTEALKMWKADALVAVKGGPQSIGTLQYNANIPGGFAMLTGLKDSMQGASGATGSLQGEEGPDREAATVGAQRYQQALDRPELAARLIEEDALAPLGRSILRRCQQYVRSTEDLQKRIGELPVSAWIGDILGDFDVQFVGSRMAMSRQQKLQAIDRVTAMSQANPAFQLVLPSQELAAWVVGELLELPEIAAKVGTPQAILGNALAMAQFGPGAGAGNGNGAVQSAEPAGMLPAQSSGAVP